MLLKVYHSLCNIILKVKTGIYNYAYTQDMYMHGQCDNDNYVVSVVIYNLRKTKVQCSGSNTRIVFIIRCKLSG